MSTVFKIMSFSGSRRFLRRLPRTIFLLPLHRDTVFFVCLFTLILGTFGGAIWAILHQENVQAERQRGMECLRTVVVKGTRSWKNGDETITVPADVDVCVLRRNGETQ